MLLKIYLQISFFQIKLFLIFKKNNNLYEKTYNNIIKQREITGTHQ